MGLLKGLASHCTILPSELFLEGAFSWHSGWHCTQSVFFWRANNYPPKLHPLSRELTFPCGPASGIFPACFVVLIPILWLPEHPLGHCAERLGVRLEPPCRDNIWRTVALMGCSLQWPLRKCHGPQGCTQKHLFQLGECPKMKIVGLLFLSFLQEILQEFEKHLSGKNV